MVYSTSWRDVFKTIILEFEERGLPELVERELRVKEYNIVSIIGPRRTGKTYYFYQLIREHRGREPVLYINFEHELLSNIESRYLREALIAFREIYGVEPKYIFLDEIQVVRGWEKFVRRLYDYGKYIVYVTGSSSKMLAREIASTLRGRTITYVLLPFSFREYLRAKNIVFDKRLVEYTDKRGLILYYLREYIERGGFPEPVLRPELYNELLVSIRDSIFYRDIIERYKIRKPHILSTIIRMLVEKYGRYHSITKIHNSLKTMGIQISKATVQEYLHILEDVMLFFYVPLLKNPFQESIKAPRKTFIVDPGLLVVYGVKGEISKLMENTVFLDLLRRKNIDPTITINYWKDEREREVDFIVRRGAKTLELIQVSYELSQDNMKRELAPLIKASKIFKADKLTIITWDQEDTIIRDNKIIKVKPLWKWLLEYP